MDAVKEEPLDVLVPFVETSVDPLAHLKMEQICLSDGSVSAPGIFTEELEHSTSNPIKTEPTDVLNEGVAEQHQDSKGPLKNLVPLLFKEEQICEGDVVSSPTGNITKELPLTAADSAARSLIKPEPFGEVEEHQDFKEPLKDLVPYLLKEEQMCEGDDVSCPTGNMRDESTASGSSGRSPEGPIATEPSSDSHESEAEEHQDIMTSHLHQPSLTLMEIS